LDIAIVSPKRKAPGVAIRMQGPVHEKHNRALKDADQRIVLEGNGWKVIDFWYYAMPNLWTDRRNEAVEFSSMTEVMKRMEGLLWDKKLKSF